jgi:hypothetical protein
MTSNHWKQNAFWDALKMVGEAQPKNLVTRAQPEAEERGESLTADDLTEVLRSAEGGNPFLTALGLHVHRWDAASSDASWTEGTPASSEARRSLICAKLGLSAEGATELLHRRPIYHDGTVVITAPWNRWYTPERASEHAFYWPRYRDYLLSIKEWPEESVTSLDLASTEVLERLTDPTRPEAYQSKGLVVGYVQSGKTANITGVVAKAIDAGYRLVIVMTGTIEMLRAQTQRRVDMELVGKQNILGDYSAEEALEAKVDYQDDDDWLAGNFLDLGEVATEVTRLTTHKKDYQKQFKTLKIERFDKSRHLFDAKNLFPTAARLVVTKKNSTVLKKLVNDIRANKNAFAEIPVLIIDDESDLASVNTVDPEVVRAAKKEGKEVQERRAINERIAEMLDLMPRAQYVGYTATPFANVFADPSDPQGIFPRDFVIGLQRPFGYMGVEDFHDFDLDPDEHKTLANSNEKAFVRDLHASEDDVVTQERELAQAIDMFVLTGAVKLYRSHVNPALKYRHHTMLVHHSVRKAEHSDMAATIKRLWTEAQFSSPVGKGRLRQLYESDVVPVSEVRLEAGVPAPPPFDELGPFISKTISFVTEHHLNPVIVVNSDKDIQQQALDFDRHKIWRILVGGAKLSRGFTVEGLTVTYFRRATRMSDSLTQMGRWFGFRPGYRDLVRLYIARQAKFGRKDVDLYEAFESVALDETAFRQQLVKYAEWDGDKPRVVPKEIPPLVSQHLPWLLPTARNKMFNARIIEQSEQPFTPSGYSNHVDELKENVDLWRPTLAAAQGHVTLPGKGQDQFEAFIGTAGAKQVVEAIDRTRYLYLFKDRTVFPKVNFYKRLIEDGLLEDFLLVVPQPETQLVDISGVGKRSIIHRDRRHGRGGKFGEMTEPKNRPIVERFISHEVDGTALEDLTRPSRGALLLYIAKEQHPDYESTPKPKLSENDPEYGLVVAFSVYVPEEALSKNPDVIRFEVIDKDRKDAPIIDAPADA